MSDQRLITLFQGEASPTDIKLRPLPVADLPSVPIYLAAGQASPTDVLLADPSSPQGGTGSIAITGQSATAAGGLLGVSIAVQLTGQVATAQQGTLGTFVGFSIQLTGQQATALGGALKPALDIPLTGQVATSAQGALTPNIAVTLTGQQATASAGVMDLAFRYARLPGQAATTSAGTLGAALAVAPSGVEAAGLASYVNLFISNPNKVVIGQNGIPAFAQLGVSVPEIDVGANTTYPVNPAIATTKLSTGLSFFPSKVQNLLVSVNGVLVGVGETNDGSHVFNLASTSKRKALYKLDQTVRPTNVWTSFGPLSNPDDLDPAFNSLSVQHFATSGLPYNNSGTDAVLGGQFSVDKEGNIHWIHTRSFGWNAAGTGPTSSYDIYYCYQTGNPLTSYAGPEVVRPQITSDGAHENSMGIYGVDASTALVFYPSICSFSGVVALQGLAASAVSGVMSGRQPVPFITLVGQQATVGQGVLKPVATGTVALVGQSATVSLGSMIVDPGNINWVPTFRRFKGGVFEGEVKLTSFTGAPECWAIQNSLCVTRSGYGDVIFVNYLSGTIVAPTVPAYVGLIVMDAVTLQVYSHVLTAITTLATTWNITLDPRLKKPMNRSLGEVVKLSSGTSITQFLLGSQVVRLSWNSASFTAPTQTLKNGPTSAVGSGHYLVPGWESLEIKGDEVYHILYDAHPLGGASNITDFKLYVNDATGTGATWNLSANTLWSWNESFSPDVCTDAWYSGYGGGKQTWLFSAPHEILVSEIAALNSIGWFNYWAGLPPILSATAEGRVGAVTVAVVNIPGAVLTGQVATAQQGAMVPNIAVALTGQQATAAGGAFVFGVVQALTGQQATSAGGALTPSIAVALTGQQATSAGGVLTPNIAVALTGQQATASGGTFSFASGTTVALTGQQAAVSAGTLVPATAVVLTGQQGVVLGGALTPNLAVPLAGKQASVLPGVLASGVSPTLTGQQCAASAGAFQVFMSKALAGSSLTVSRGSMTLHADQNLTITGVQATGLVGLTYTDAAPLNPDLAWARLEVEKLFASFDPDEVFTLIDPR